MSVYFYDGFWWNLLHYVFWLLLHLPFGFLFHYIVDRYLQVRPKWWAHAGIVLTGMIAAANIIYIGDAFNILFFLLFFAAALWFCVKGSRMSPAFP